MSNILFWLESGYFDASADLKPLLHTWSLAVEEQYYIVLPPLLFLLWKWGRDRLVWVIALITLCSLLLCQWMASHYPMANFFLLPSRAWELLAGSLCACAQVGGRQSSGNVLAALGLTLVFVAIFLFDATTPFPSFWTLVPVLGTVLIILFAGPGTFVARLLSTAPFVNIGLVSYSAYLWHQPVFAFTRIYFMTETTPSLMFAMVLISLGLAWISWRVVELPFRSYPAGRKGAGKAFLPSRNSLFSMSGLVIMAMILMGLIGDRTRLHTQWWREQQTSESLRAYDLFGLAQQSTHREISAVTTLSPETCRFRLDTDAEASLDVVADHLASCHDKYGPGLLVIGDSHAGNLYSALFNALPNPFLVGVTTGGCRPHDNDPGCFYDDLSEFIAANSELFGNILFEQAGFYLLRAAGGEHEARELFLHKSLEDSLPLYEADAKDIEKVAIYLEGLAAHVPVTWLGPRPDPHIPREVMIRAGCAAQFKMRPNQIESYVVLERAIAARLVDSPVSFVSQIDAMKLDMAVDLMSCDVLYWSDGDHFTSDGARRFGPRIAEALEK